MSEPEFSSPWRRLAGLRADDLLAAGLEEDFSLPGYERIERLGQGGMGTVHLCRQASLDRLVAVKVLSADWREHAALLRRLEQEARVMAQLQHPHVVTVHDFLAAPEGGAAMVLEYVEGGSLRRVLAAHPRGLPVAEALRWLRQIASGLAAAHRLGVAHRDIKPENVLLDQNGDAKVTDFGLALPILEQQAARLTSEGATAGTLDYMAPEQLERGVANARSDVFSLGVLAYEMLTGRIPRGHFDPPRQVHAEIPAAVSAAVMRALRSRPEDRFASMEAFQEALSRPAPGGAGTRLGAAAAMLAGVAALAWWWLALDSPPASATAALPAQVEAGAARAGRSSENAPAGSWLDATAGLDLQRDMYSGNWHRDESGVLISDDNACVLLLRREMPAAYDVRMRFTRLQNAYPVALFFRTAQGMGSCLLDALHQGLSGVQAIDGKDLTEGHGFPFRLENGRSYELLLEVRPEEVRVHVDGEFKKAFDIRNRELSLTPYWNWDLLRRPAALAIGSAQCPTRFESVEWRERPGPPSPQPSG